MVALYRIFSALWNGSQDGNKINYQKTYVLLLPIFSVNEKDCWFCDCLLVFGQRVRLTL